MKTIPLKRILCFILSFVMMLMLAAAVLPSPALAVSQAEINALKEQQSGLKSQENALQSTINALKGEQSATIELKTALDEKNALTLQQILNLNEQIEMHNELIAQKAVEVNAAQKVADAQLEKYRVRVRNMEENGRYSYLDVLFGASSIGEFLSLIDDIGDIMRSDKALEKAYRDSVKELEAVKAEYEDAKAELETKKAELQVLSDQLMKDIEEAAAVIAALEGDISENSAVLADLAAQDKALQTQINNKIYELNQQQKKEEEERRRQQQQTGGGGSSTPSGSGKLTVWPANTTYITSVQGNRVHPVTGQYGTHGGTDIGASYGSPIYASGSGTVTVAYNDSGYNGGYGNYCMINHGNGVQTLYAHMSVCSVSAGQYVSAGQVIGYVGATGRVTGAHLHFEVWSGGARQDPQAYFPNLSYAYSATAWGG